MIEQQLHDELSAHDGQAGVKMDSLRRKARESFAASCGWRFYSTDRPARLIPGILGTMREARANQDMRYPEIDHCESFTLPNRRTIRCVVTHTYLRDHALWRVAAMVERYGLTAVELAWSWYYPRHCAAIALLPSGASMPTSPWVKGSSA